MKYEHDQFAAWPGMANKASKRPFANECKWQFLGQWNWSTWKNSYRTWFNERIMNLKLRFAVICVYYNQYLICFYYMNALVTFFSFFWVPEYSPVVSLSLRTRRKVKRLIPFFPLFAQAAFQIMQYLMGFRDTPWLLIFFFDGGL